MANEFQGTDGSVADKKFAIVVSRYHASITEKLVDGALQTLARNDVLDDNISIVRVPGTFELPCATKHLLDQAKYDAIICLGCVIRGETTHDQHINTSVSNMLGQLTVESRTPIAFGVLTCNSMDQAIQRAGGDVGNKGIECAEAVLEMLRLFDSL